MPLDQPAITNAAFIRSHIEQAARYLWLSTEADGSLMRCEWCLKASRSLRHAASVAVGEQHDTLTAHCRQAEALAGQFYGDGMGVSRLLDELQTLTGAKL